MSRCSRRIAGVLNMLAASTAFCAQPTGHAGVGRAALPEEIRAWDIDVRPDFDGLPPGSGSVTRGQQIWDEQCASCHGVFGESTEVYRPIVGGTTAEDMKTGRAATLASDAPLVTTLSKLSTISTLWDYIRRAMPWTAPKTLSPDDVYALLAYILYLGDIVPAGFVLSDTNIRDVQAILPNRFGLVPHEGLWEVDGKPDVKNVACVKDCPTRAEIISEFPERALAAHGNPADQHRPWGPIPGVSIQTSAPSQQGSRNETASARQLAQSAGCLACHGIEKAVVGPGFMQIASRYRGAEGDPAARLVAAVKSGGAGIWGTIPMPPQQINDTNLRAIIQWILDGAATK